MMLRNSRFFINTFSFDICWRQSKIDEFQLTFVIGCIRKTNTYVLWLEIVVHTAYGMEMFDQSKKLDADLTNSLLGEHILMPFKIILQRLPKLCHNNTRPIHEFSIFNRPWEIKQFSFFKNFQNVAFDFVHVFISILLDYNRFYVYLS